jgi:Methionine biosynthesis protein MetW
MNLLSIPRCAARKIRDQARLLFKAASTLMVRTNVRRWREVAKNPRPHWDGRNEIIAKLIPPGSSVIDLGCGPQTLRRHLDPSCKYQPCDVIQSTPDVIFCDFNSGIYPEIGGSYDYVICSGVFEYIRNPAEFLKKNSLLARTMILSYNPLYQMPGDSKIRRLNCDWINHFTKPEVEALFDEVGLSWKILNIAKDGETIYSLHVPDKKEQR